MSYEPELGQAIFSNSGWEEYEAYDLAEGLYFIGRSIQAVRGDAGSLAANYGETPWLSSTFNMRTYCWCDGEGEHEDGCPPNFEHHGTGLKVYWYKHAARGTSANHKIDPVLWGRIVADCLTSVLPKPREWPTL